MNDDRIIELTRRVDELARSLASIEGRLSRLETSAAETSAGIPAEPAVPPPQSGAAVQALGTPTLVEREEMSDAGFDLTLIGRSLIVLGGAYLLRAITEFAVLPSIAGVTLGFAYALLFVWLADRDAGRGMKVSASFHGCVATLIAFPLVWESVSRFEIIPPAGAATVILVFSLTQYAVIARRNLIPVGWFVSIAAGATMVGLVTQTKTIVPFGWALLLLVAGAIPTGRRIGQRGIASVVGLFADLTFLALAILSMSGQSPDGYVATITVLTTYFVFFVAVVARRVVQDGTDPSVAGITHIAAATVIGALGTMRAAWTAGTPFVIGILYLAMAPIAYSFAFHVRAKSRRAFTVFSTLGLALVVSSSILALPVEARMALWLAACIVARQATHRIDSGALDFQIAVYLWAAAWGSGLVATSAKVLALPASSDWGSITWLGGFVLLFATMMTVFGMRSRGSEAAFRYLIPRLAAFALVSLGLAGALVQLVTQGLLEGNENASLVALVRTIVIASLILVLAAVSRRERFLETSLLVYPALAIGGVKLLLEDLRVGQPGTLFITLAIFGGVLIVTPRLRGRRRRRTKQGSGDDAPESV